MSSKRAPFIVIEGLDRSGKTTQTSLLQSKLESAGIATKLMKFPDRTTTIGQMIDSYLKSTSELDDHVIHLLFSANRWELASTIESLLNEGTTVLCDRYAFSGIAFSASKIVASSSSSADPVVPKLPFEWCRAPDIGLPAPDVVLFLDIAPEQAKQRGGFGEERYEKEEMQARVRKLFERIGEETSSSSLNPSPSSSSSPTAAERLPQDGRNTLDWVIVDAGKDVESVSAELWDAVYPLARDGTNHPIGKLWAHHFA
ncbi:hypothetical protein FA15DRAFT_655393 [Coprinopsis marcescibilis]|uniref:Thymidylate kinase n=1 Tax=Coprinopsis marcescibilis TaxID=230819 RepID=A0A5C3KZ83_COPMA|nr:hypothetical protein FA15DRAFT_655393 [Coprinopsis marcescibilis]